VVHRHHEEAANKDKDSRRWATISNPKAAVNKNSGLVWHYGGRSSQAKEHGRRKLSLANDEHVAIHDGLVYAAELTGYLHVIMRRRQEESEHDFRRDVELAYYVDGKVFHGHRQRRHVGLPRRQETGAVRKINMSPGQLKVPPLAHKRGAVREQRLLPVRDRTSKK